MTTPLTFAWRDGRTTRHFWAGSPAELLDRGLATLDGWMGPAAGLGEHLTRRPLWLAVRNPDLRHLPPWLDLRHTFEPGHTFASVAEALDERAAEWFAEAAGMACGRVWADDELVDCHTCGTTYDPNF